jgi:hypothetical protein
MKFLFGGGFLCRAFGQWMMKNQMINVKMMQKQISYRKPIVLDILIDQYIFCINKILIVIYIYVRYYKKRKEFMLQNFVVYNKAKWNAIIIF